MLLPLLSVLAAASPDAPMHVDRTPVVQAIQAKDGTVYARRSGGVSWFSDAAWHDVVLKPGRSVELLAADPNRGGVVALATVDGHWELWRSWKKEVGLVATGDAPIPPKPWLFATSTGSVWLLGDSRRLIEVTPEGRVNVHVLEPSWLVTPESPKIGECRGLTPAGCCEESLTGGQLYCGSVRMFEANHALWFWSKGSSNSYVLPGLLKYNGVFTPWNKPGLPSAVTRAVLPLGDAALLSANSALYRLNLGERSATPEAFPPLKDQTPQNILAMYRSKQTTWALVERSFQQRAGILFRRTEGQAAYERAVEGVGGSIYQFMEDPVFASAMAPEGTEHVWLAPPGGALWHLSGASPELVDWSRGLSFLHITGVFLVDSKSLLVTDANDGSMVMAAWSAAPAPSTQVKRFAFMNKAVTWTSDRRVWWLEEKDPLELHGWNGDSLSVLHPPAGTPDTPSPSGSTLFADSSDSLWIPPSPSRGFPDEGPAVPHFDTRTGQWSKAASYVEALKLGSSQKLRGVTGWDVGALPAVLADGTMCVSDPKRSFSCAFPGQKWKRWAPDEISGEGGSSPWTTPSVGPDGALNVVVNHHGKNTTWGLYEGAWKRVADAVEPRPTPGKAPAHCGATSIPVVGEDGRVWFSAGAQLMVSRGELCRPRLNELTLSSGASFARFDARQHDLAAVGSELVVFTDDTSFPETKLGTPRVSLDSVTLPVKGAEGAAEYRVDQGAWTAVELPSDDVLLIEGLRRGKHHLEVRSASAHLRVDPTPASLELDITYQDAALVETLLALARQPEAKAERLAPRMRLVAGLIAPKLKAARAEAHDAQVTHTLDELIQALNSSL